VAKQSIEQVIQILCGARGKLIGKSQDEMLFRFIAKYGEDYKNQLPEAHLGLVLEQNKVILKYKKLITRLEEHLGLKPWVDL